MIIPVLCDKSTKETSTKLIDDLTESCEIKFQIFKVIHIILNFFNFFVFLSFI